jgi:hypothetical protein
MFARRSPHRAVSTLLIAMSLVATPAFARAAREEVAILPFAGPSAARARSGLVKALLRLEVPLGRSRQYLRTARRLGVAPAAPTACHVSVRSSAVTRC